jgi:hypothetical protein
MLAIWCHENGVLGSYLKLSGVYGVLGVFRSTAGTGIRVFRLFFFSDSNQYKQQRNS